MNRINANVIIVAYSMTHHPLNESQEGEPSWKKEGLTAYRLCKIALRSTALQHRGYHTKKVILCQASPPGGVFQSIAAGVKQKTA
ncbi:MAG: hypothetical protein IKN72_02410 [Clostridia bacterium]|nr:hypothetical protein [Clostridia bacterium]